MAHVTPKEIEAALKRWAVPYSLVDGWDSPRIDPYHNTSDFQAVIVHHTASSGDSLRYIVDGNPYAPVRACHFLVSRDGVVHVVSGLGAYHGGAGGPMTIEGSHIPKDAINSRSFGIEVESAGATQSLNDGPHQKGGFTAAQTVTLALLCRSLVDLIHKSEKSVIGHKEWTPRKIDPRTPMDYWRKAVAAIGHWTWDGKTIPPLGKALTSKDHAVLQARLYDLGIRPLPARNPLIALFPNKSLRKFQLRYGLPQTGKYDPATAFALFGKRP